MVNEKSMDNLQPAQKGEIKNPSGRPKGAKGYKTILEKVLTTDIEVDGSKKQCFEHIILALVKKAINGDTKAADILIKRALGDEFLLKSSNDKIQINIINPDAKIKEVNKDGN